DRIHPRYRIGRGYYPDAGTAGVEADHSGYGASLHYRRGTGNGKGGRAGLDPGGRGGGRGIGLRTGQGGRQSDRTACIGAHRTEKRAETPDESSGGGDSSKSGRARSEGGRACAEGGRA